MSDRRLTGSAEPASLARAETVAVTVSDLRAGQKLAPVIMNSGEKCSLPGEARRGDECAGAVDECAGERADSRSDDRDAQQPSDQAGGADDAAAGAL